MSAIPAGTLFAAEYRRGVDSWLIKVFTRVSRWMERRGWRDRRYSHVGVVIDNHGQTLEARSRGIVRDTINRYIGDRNARVTLWIPDSAAYGERIAAAGQAAARLLVGQPYPWKQLLGIVVVWYNRFFKNKIIKNPWGAGADCVEVVKIVLTGGEPMDELEILRGFGGAGLALPAIDENSTPEDAAEAFDTLRMTRAELGA